MSKESPIPKNSPKERVENLRRDFKKAVPVVADKFKQAGEMVQSGVSKIIPQKHDEPELKYFKLLGITFVGLIVIGGLAGLMTFLLTLRTPEAVSVPKVAGLELTDAIEELQDYGLINRLEQRYVSDPATKGKVIDQDPKEGTSVRVGREVTLVVSKGPLLNEIGNYVGRQLEDVRQELRIQFGSDDPLLSVGALSYVFDQSEAGTIISQDPVPGTALSRQSQVSFLISRGKDESLRQVPKLLGTNYVRAIETLAALGIPFEFSFAEAGGEQGPGLIASQDPAEETSVDATAKVKLSVVRPEAVSDKQVVGLYTYTLPEYALPVDILVRTVDPTGNQNTLYRFKHKGGILSFPYQLSEGTELIISAFGKDIDHRLVSKE